VSLSVRKCVDCAPNSRQSFAGGLSSPSTPRRCSVSQRGGDRSRANRTVFVNNELVRKADSSGGTVFVQIGGVGSLNARNSKSMNSRKYSVGISVKATNSALA